MRVRRVRFGGGGSGEEDDEEEDGEDCAEGEALLLEDEEVDEACVAVSADVEAEELEAFVRVGVACTVDRCGTLLGCSRDEEAECEAVFGRKGGGPSSLDEEEDAEGCVERAEEYRLADIDGPDTRDEA